MIFDTATEDLLLQTSRKLSVISFALEGIYVKLDKSEEGEENPIFSALLGAVEQLSSTADILVDTAYDGTRPNGVQ